MDKPDDLARALRTRLDFSDAQLLAECEVHTYRASGPGGQKRNKTSSAVRLHHGPSGLRVIAEESRSQHENKARALRRLRELIAVEFRLRLPDIGPLPANVISTEQNLRIGAKNPERVKVIAIILDWLNLHEGDLSACAKSLGVTSSSVSRFLAGTPRAWVRANEIRVAFGRKALRQS